MTLQYGLLGLLTYQDATGYDLSKLFRGSLNFFWHAQNSQIYRELGRLEERGLVVSRNVIQSDRPNKKVYSITDLGRKEFSDWLSEAKVEIENPHIAMLMRVFFGSDDPEATIKLLRDFRDQTRVSIGVKRPQAQKNAAAYAHIAKGGEEKSKYWLMTMDFVTMQKLAMIEWAENCISQLKKEELK